MKWCEKYFAPGVSVDAGNSSGTSTSGSGGGRGGSNSLGVWHVPQLHLEMLCAGPHCRSAVIVVLFASGAYLYRVERNDEVSDLRTQLLPLHF